MSDLCTLRIEGPGKNALGLSLMKSLRAQLREAGDRPVLLVGSGDAFSAGLNLKELVDLDTSGMAEFLEELQGLASALFDHPAPTVAAVNGHAIAGGCVLALCCDWKVGTTNPKAKIGLNEVALGLRFPARLLRILRHQLPSLDRVTLHAGLHDPDMALRLGLVDELAEDAEATGLKRLEGFARHPREGYAAAKATLRGGLTTANPAEEQTFLEEIVPTWTSEELKARVRAVLGLS